jgi:hypothetical protein
VFQKTECPQVSMHIHWKYGQRFSHNEEPDPLKTCWNWFKIVKFSLLWPLAVLIVHPTGTFTICRIMPLSSPPPGSAQNTEQNSGPTIVLKKRAKTWTGFNHSMSRDLPWGLTKASSSTLELGCVLVWGVCVMPCTRCLHLVNLVP